MSEKVEKTLNCIKQPLKLGFQVQSIRTLHHRVLLYINYIYGCHHQNGLVKRPPIVAFGYICINLTIFYPTATYPIDVRVCDAAHVRASLPDKIKPDPTQIPYVTYRNPNRILHGVPKVLGKQYHAPTNNRQMDDRL